MRLRSQTLVSCHSADKLENIVRAFSEIMAKQAEEQNARMLEMLRTFQIQTTYRIPKFEAFPLERELFKDYINRFETLILMNSIPASKAAQVFLTNQTPEIYKRLEILASLLRPPQEIHNLQFQKILQLIESQYDPKLFVVRERYKFYTAFKRLPGESVQELASKIRKGAVT